MRKEDAQIRFDSLPLGLCPACLERMQRGEGIERWTLADGALQIATYCVERQAGADAIAYPGRPVKWRIQVPVDAVVWRRYLELTGTARAGMQQLAELARHRGAGEVH